MIQLKNIVKNYYVGDITVEALAGVSLSFRSHEFVSVLGPSGCGKTTLLNIIGGLDRYTDGDIIVNGKSTKDFKDKDWDAFRNHSVGFVFQSYNLIPHQTVLKNVELALTLSGVKREERRQRAKSALERVGLGEQLNKRPNQLSGGQMQRVAIARAIVNNPDIILADEPTGALDTETSIQVMEILKELSKTKLVVMVTHNPELAENYSTRIINLKDGRVIDDSAPYECEAETPAEEEKVKKPSMSFLTALSLSLNNLVTKKARTILTAFAGSIGIIGIAVILSLSAGFNAYIDTVQRDTLSNYPVSIQKANVDYMSILSSLMGTDDRGDIEKYPSEDKVTSRNMIKDMLDNVVHGVQANDLKSFKAYLDKNIDKDVISAVKYTYNLSTEIYAEDELGVRALSPIHLPPLNTVVAPSVQELAPMLNYTLGSYYAQFESMMTTQPAFAEMIDNIDLIRSQYDVLEGQLPKNANEAVLVVDEYNQIDDMTLYMLGLMTDDDLKYVFNEMSLKLAKEMGMLPEEWSNCTDEDIEQFLAASGLHRTTMEFTFESLLSAEYTVILPGEKYVKAGTAEAEGTPVDYYELMPDEDLKAQLKNKTVGETLKISGIVRKKKNVSSGALSASVCYTKELTEKLVAKNDKLDIVIAHNKELENSAVRAGGAPTDALNHIYSVIPVTVNDVVIPAGQIITPSTYAIITATLGVVDIEDPASISIYPTSFENKDKVIDLINKYNSQNDLSKQIKYTDYIGLLLSSVTVIINAITYVLIAFVSISLIVSSIMIGIITYISVLERTKEIGVLRSIGASKKDIKRVFNAETFIIGLASGLIGIIATLLINIPVNIIIGSLTTLNGIASLPIIGGFVLVLVSVVLTVVAGLIPAHFASKKDPVIALRTE